VRSLCAPVASTLPGDSTILGAICLLESVHLARHPSDLPSPLACSFGPAFVHNPSALLAPTSPPWDSIGCLVPDAIRSDFSSGSRDFSLTTPCAGLGWTEQILGCCSRIFTVRFCHYVRFQNRSTHILTLYERDIWPRVRA